MLSVFLILCQPNGHVTMCNITPVSSLAVCHALGEATDRLGRDIGAYDSRYRCVSIRSK